MKSVFTVLRRLFGKIAVTLSVGRYCRRRNDAKAEMKNGLTATARYGIIISLKLSENHAAVDFA